MLTQRDKNILIYLEQYHAISIKQAHKIFFNETKMGYDVARKRLRQLEEMGLMQSYTNLTTSQKVYYTDRKISAHSLYVMDFYSLLHWYGCKDIEFVKEPRFLNNLIRADGYFSFEFNNCLYFIILEVDLTSYTSETKFQKYEKLYRDKELQQKLGTFPLIVVMSFDGRKIRYKSENFEVIYTDFDLSNFKNDILGIV